MVTQDMFDSELFKGGGFLRSTVKKYHLNWGLFETLFLKMESFNHSCPGLLLKNVSRKWEVVSSIQKSIRRGLKDHALRGASALLNTNDFELIRYLWKRISTTAAEDVGLADPTLVAFTLLCAETFTPSKFMAVQKPVVYFLISELCNSVKDRTLCDGAILDSSWVRSGNKAIISSGLDEENLKYVHKFERCKEYLPETPLMSYLSNQGWRTEDMGKFYPLGEHLRDGFFDEVEKPLTEFRVIKGLPSYAYDMHTQIGKRAIGFLSGRGTELFEFFKLYPQVTDSSKAVGWALFYSEGGLLNTQLEYPSRTGVYNTAVFASLLNLGVGRDGVLKLIALVREALPRLEGKREAIAEASYG